MELANYVKGLLK